MPLIYEAKRQNQQELAELLFNVIDYKILKEAQPTDSKGKPKKAEKAKLVKSADTLRKNYKLDYYELQTKAKEAEAKKIENKAIQKVDLNQLKITIKSKPI